MTSPAASSVLMSSASSSCARVPQMAIWVAEREKQQLDHCIALGEISDRLLVLTPGADYPRTGSDEFAELAYTVGSYPIHFRFFAMRYWLAARIHQYDRVLISDSRDVVFQADPFEEMPAQAEPHVRVYAEHVWFANQTRLCRSRTNVKCFAVNEIWVSSCFGIRFHAALVARGLPVLCAGIMMGTPSEVVALLSLWAARYVAMVEDKSLPCKLPGRSNNRNLIKLAASGADQAIFNMIIHEEAAAAGVNVRVMYPESDPSVLLTNNPFQYSGLRWETSPDGHPVALNPGGVPYAIVHQADRNQSFFAPYVHRWQTKEIPACFGDGVAPGG